MQKKFILNVEEKYFSKHIYIIQLRFKVEKIEHKSRKVYRNIKYLERYTLKVIVLFICIKCCKEVQSGLITHDTLGSIPKYSQTYMAKLVDAYDLKSYPAGCWFKSSYKYMKSKILLLFLRRTRSFNKSKYARNRQLARVIFYIGLYINLIVIFGVFSIFYSFMFKLAN